MALQVKDPDEKIVITFDFTTIPETISNPVVEIREVGFDDLLPDMLEGFPQIATNKVLQLVVGGESGKKYNVRCEVDVVETGEHFVAKGVLPVKT